MVLYAGVGDLAREMGVGEVLAGIWLTALTRALKRSSKYESTKSSDLRFRALLADGTSEVELALN